MTKELQAIFDEAKKHGCGFELRDGKLLCTGPTKALPEDIRESIKANMLAIKREVQWQIDTSGTLGDFIDSDRVFRFWSEVVGAVVVFAGQHAVIPAGQDVVFRGQELRLLLGRNSEDIRDLYELKSLYPDGLLMESQENAQDLALHGVQSSFDLGIAA